MPVLELRCEPRHFLVYALEAAAWVGVERDAIPALDLLDLPEKLTHGPRR